RPVDPAHANTESRTGAGETVAANIAASGNVIGITLHPHGDRTDSIAARVRSRGKSLPLHWLVRRHVSRAVVGNAVVGTATGVSAAAAEVIRVESRAIPIGDR